MSNWETAARQNLRVWARRLNVEVSSEQADAVIVKADGSILTAPLAYLFSRRIRANSMLEAPEVKTLAWLAARSCVAVLRGVETNVLTALAKACQSNADKLKFASHSPKLCKLVGDAIAARTEERNRPSVANVVLAKKEW